MTKNSRRLPLPALVLLAACAPLPPSVSGQSSAGRVEEIVVHGPSLERNGLGIPADRNVSVYLPPSYSTSTRRYPVLYVLHGIMDSRKTWTEPWDRTQPGWNTIQQLMDRGIAARTLREMIVVVADAEQTCHYTDSPVKGGWGTFIATDLVNAIDAGYRTIPVPESRGIMGHSMGGHGAIKLAMTRPGIFSAVYALNPSLLGFGGEVSVENAALAELARLKAPADLATAGSQAQAIVGVGQCFSPDLSAPLLTAFPFIVDATGRVRMSAAADRWAAQMPMHMARAHIPALKALRGLRFDSAFEDEYAHIPITTRAFASLLDSLRVRHTFELYEGDHRNRLWGEQGRINTKALPFFSELLSDRVPRAVAAAIAAAARRGGAPSAARNTAPGATPGRDPQRRLWDAAISGDTAEAARALTAGADVAALDTTLATSGRRALNYAAERDRPEMIRWLVAHGAEVSRPNRSGFTPLHHAAEAGALAATEALLALGADPSARLRTGSRPLEIARQRGRAAVVQLLEKRTPP